jgi:tetratricopeptide (TPR) repeat protein
MAVPDKAREQRLKRLNAMVTTKLEQPPAALEALLAELELDEPQFELWEALHAAASRDKMGPALGAAYLKIAGSQRIQRLIPVVQAAFLMHAADFFQGALGDTKTADELLERVLKLVPGHPVAYQRLERRVEGAKDDLRALELYANAAPAPPVAPATLANKAINRLVLLTDKSPLSDEACKRLVFLAPEAPRLLTVLESHCRLTKRAALACELLEDALALPSLPEATALEQRHRLLELYGADARAMPHVELLLAVDPADAAARKAAEKLLSVREVASQASAALQTARRNSQPPPRSVPPPRSQPPPRSSGG